MAEELGSIRVSPQVVAAIIALSAAGVPGVACLNACGRQQRPLRSAEELGQAVRLNVQGDAVQADIYLTVERGVNMTQVGLAVQQEVGEAIRRMLGLDVRAINVYIVDMVR
ncbi:MAG: Asp23/Gls24 family envelope stress response protein [Chloroflexia bacterium]